MEVPGGTLGPANLGLEPELVGGGEDTLGTFSGVVFFFCCSLDSSLILLVLISVSESESEESESSSNRLLTSLIIELISSLLWV